MGRDGCVLQDNQVMSSFFGSADSCREGGCHRRRTAASRCTRLCTRLNKHHIQLLRLSLSLVCGHLSLLWEVRLVPDQHDDDVRPALRPQRRRSFLRRLMEEFALVISYTTTATRTVLSVRRRLETWTSPGPAVSQSWSLTVLSSRYIVFDRKI